MRKRLLAFLALAVLIAIALGALLVSHEPTYKGRTMGEWLREENYAQAHEAILILGTNNLPLLVKRLSHDHGKDPVVWAVNKLPFKWTYGTKLGRAAFGRPNLSYEALDVLLQLGTNGAPALPQLATVVRQGDSGSPFALLAAASFGPEGLKFITSQLSNPDPKMRLLAVNLMGARLEDGHTVSQLALSGLTNAMSDTDPQVHLMASNLLHRHFEATRPDHSLQTTEE